VKATESVVSAATHRSGLLAAIIDSSGSGRARSGAFKNSSRLRRRARILAPALAVVALLTVFSSSALAARGHVFDPSLTIGTPCTAEPCGPGELKEPSAVAVNEATGDVYVVDQGNDRIDRFDAAGNFLGEFDGSATPAGAFSFGSEPQVSAIAVDNSCVLQNLTGGACESADPSNGDLYAIDAGHEVIDKFSPTGAYLGQITEADGSALTDPTGLAVDNPVPA
jgi:hypothetical protein